MTGKFRKTVFLLVLTISIAVLAVVTHFSNLEKDKFRLDWMKFDESANLLQEGKVVEAEKSYKELLEKYPDSSALLWRYSRCLFSRGDFNGADHFFNLTMKAEPYLTQRSIFIFHLGLVSFRLGNYPKAIFCLFKAAMSGEKY